MCLTGDCRQNDFRSRLVNECLRACLLPSQLRRERDTASRVSAESIRANIVQRQHEENAAALPGVDEATLKYVFDHATSILATAAVRHKATEVCALFLRG